VATTNPLLGDPRLRLMRVCLIALAILAAAAVMAVASVYVSSAYDAPGQPSFSRADPRVTRVMTLDHLDLEQAANLYRPVP
jgi:hypothetical protein